MSKKGRKTIEIKRYQTFPRRLIIMIKLLMEKNPTKVNFEGFLFLGQYCDGNAFAEGRNSVFSGREEVMSLAVNVTQVAKGIYSPSEGFCLSIFKQLLIEEFEFPDGAGNFVGFCGNIPLCHFFAVKRSVVCDVDFDNKRLVARYCGSGRFEVTYREVGVTQTVTEFVHRVGGNILIKSHIACAGRIPAVIVDRNLSHAARESNVQFATWVVRAREGAGYGCACLNAGLPNFEYGATKRNNVGKSQGTSVGK